MRPTLITTIHKLLPDSHRHGTLRRGKDQSTDKLESTGALPQLLPIKHTLHWSLPPGKISRDWYHHRTSMHHLAPTQQRPSVSTPLTDPPTPQPHSNGTWHNHKNTVKARTIAVDHYHRKHENKDEWCWRYCSNCNHLKPKKMEVVTTILFNSPPEPAPSNARSRAIKESWSSATTTISVSTKTRHHGWWTKIHTYTAAEPHCRRTQPNTTSKKGGQRPLPKGQHLQRQCLRRRTTPNKKKSSRQQTTPQKSGN